MLRLDFSNCSHPTSKMVNYATIIHAYLNDGLTQEEFDRVLSDFTRCSEYIETYKKPYIQKRADYSGLSGDCASSFSVSRFADDWGICCIDMGICPWGDG